MPPFEPVAKQPDHIALEHRVLERWERERTFETLRDRNRGGPPFSFIDGPITANNPMGVHHGWGRTLKDIWQRYHAMLGHDLRYQNGFDCQGLWVEVGVEKELGLNSKREIEAYGLDRFARACRDRVAHYAGQLTEHSKRLGQWMDWERSYYTMTDPNISYIWGFLKELPRARLALPRPPLDAVVPALRHVALPARADRLLQGPHPPVAVRAASAARAATASTWWCGRRRPGRSRPTSPPPCAPTPTTCASRRRPGIAYVAADAARARAPSRATCSAPCAGPSWSGSPTRRRSTSCRPRPASSTGWSPGRTCRWTRAPASSTSPRAAARRTSSSAAARSCATLIPVDEAGAFTSEYGWLHGHVTAEAAQMIVDDLGQRGRLVADGEITHRYPVCWRCGTELIYRLVDEWFIRCDEIRQPMIEAAREVEWTPPQYGKRMEDWLRNMGDWCISRKRYWGLPLPFYFCDDGHMTVIGSQDELLERALRGTEGLDGAAPAVDRRRRHPPAASAAARPTACPRSATAGSTPASSRSRRSAGTTRPSSRRATPRAPAWA